MSEESSSLLSRKVTLKELGATLPVYRLTQDKKPIVDRSFSFIPWDMEIEEKLSAASNKAKNIGVFMNEMMCTLVDNLCGVDFQSLPKEQRMLMINQLEWPNMMYMYIYLRTEELGTKLKLTLDCPSCGKKIDNFEADLNELDVNIKDTPTAEDCGHGRVARYELVKPIIVDDKTTVTAFDLDVSKWEYMERIEKGDGENGARMKQFMLKSSICGFYAGEGKVDKFLDPQTVFKKLKKIDIELSIKKLMENNVGPEPAIAGTCHHCKREWKKLLDWTYQSFFDSSSL